MVRLPTVGANVQSKGINTRSRSELNIVFKILLSIWESVAHHEVGEDCLVSTSTLSESIVRERMRYGDSVHERYSAEAEGSKERRYVHDRSWKQESVV